MKRALVSLEKVRKDGNIWKNFKLPIDKVGNWGYCFITY